jgi:hypothetical protein
VMIAACHRQSTNRASIGKNTLACVGTGGPRLKNGFAAYSAADAATCVARARSASSLHHHSSSCSMIVVVGVVAVAFEDVWYVIAFVDDAEEDDDADDADAKQLQRQSSNVSGGGGGAASGASGSGGGSGLWLGGGCGGSGGGSLPNTSPSFGRALRSMPVVRGGSGGRAGTPPSNVRLAMLVVIFLLRIIVLAPEFSES